MEINEQLAQAISTLIQGVEVGQKAGAYDLKSAGILNQAVMIATNQLNGYGQQVEAQDAEEQEVPVKKMNSKKQ